jgi:preprotein translocase subunit SecY
VQINPQKIADNFQKSGKFIPGIKPGRDTEKYLTNVINRLSTFGSIGLALIAVLPYVISKVTNLPSSLAIGGTGLIIMVTVSLQTVRQVKGRLVQQYFAAYKSMKKSEKTGSNDSDGVSSNNPFL